MGVSLVNYVGSTKSSSSLDLNLISQAGQQGNTVLATQNTLLLIDFAYICKEEFALWILHWVEIRATPVNVSTRSPPLIENILVL